MDEDRIRFRQPRLGVGKLRRVEVSLSLTAVVAVLLVAIRLRNAPVTPPSMQVITYLDGDPECPVDEGDPVCLTGAVEAIGRIKSVRALGRRWEVVMSLDKRYRAKIPADSVTLLRMSWNKGGRCGFSGAQGNTEFGKRIRFLEIDTTVYGRCFDKPNCKVSEALIARQAVLQVSYRLFCGEDEGVTCGGLVEFLPRPWWRPAIDRAIDFVVMDIGVIYVELFGVLMIVIAGVTALVILARRSVRGRAKRAAVP